MAILKGVKTCRTTPAPGNCGREADSGPTASMPFRLAGEERERSEPVDGPFFVCGRCSSGVHVFIPTREMGTLRHLLIPYEAQADVPNIVASIGCGIRDFVKNV